MANESTEILVLKAQAGDKDAFDELLSSIQLQLWHFAYRIVLDSHHADDVIQEVFLIIYRKIGWLNDPKLFSPWAYRITSRECFRQLKRENRWKQQIRDEETLRSIEAPIDSELNSEIIERLPGLLSNISPASRAVLVLHYLDELTLSETADILDISIGTAKSRLAYGLKSLRDQLLEEPAK